MPPLQSAGLTWSSPHFHGVGLGNEAPVGSWRHKDSSAQVLREGTVLAFEPGAETAAGKGLHIGDTVLLTRNGPQRLGSRQPEILVVK